jgi:hypothetical protein
MDGKNQLAIFSWTLGTRPAHNVFFTILIVLRLLVVPRIHEESVRVQGWLRYSVTSHGIR